jgi:hypothetical protein
VRIVRRSIDDDQVPVPPGREDDEAAVSWAVGIVDDYDDGAARVHLLVEELGGAGAGFALHLDATRARRLRLALASALAEMGEEPGR